MGNMAHKSVTSADVDGRSRVDKLSLADPKEALKVARAIRHPWYRCQALSKVSEHWGTKEQRLALLQEALDAAQEQSEINRIVSVSAWPLAVMAKVDRGVVPKHLRRLVDVAAGEPHSLRRADALFMLAEAMRADTPLLSMVVPSLIEALLHGHGWRIDRLIRWTIEITKSSLPETVDRLVEHHSEGREKRVLIESLRLGK
jgi:hypothetical protein